MGTWKCVETSLCCITANICLHNGLIQCGRPNAPLLCSNKLRKSVVYECFHMGKKIKAKNGHWQCFTALKRSSRNDRHKRVWDQRNADEPKMFLANSPGNQRIRGEVVKHKTAIQWERNFISRMQASFWCIQFTIHRNFKTTSMQHFAWKYTRWT